MKVLISTNLFLVILTLLFSQTCSLKLSDVVQLRKQLKKMDQGETGLPEGRKLAELAPVSLEDFEQNIEVHSKNKTKTQRKIKSPKLRRRSSNFKKLRPSRKLAKIQTQSKTAVFDSPKINLSKKASHVKSVSTVAKFAQRIESDVDKKISSRRLKKVEKATFNKKIETKKAKESIKKTNISGKNLSLDTGCSKKETSVQKNTEDRKLLAFKSVKKHKKNKKNSKAKKAVVKKSKQSKSAVKKHSKAKTNKSKTNKVLKTRKTSSKNNKTAANLKNSKVNKTNSGQQQTRKLESPSSILPETKTTERKLLDMPSQNEFYEQIVSNYYPTI